MIDKVHVCCDPDVDDHCIQGVHSVAGKLGTMELERQRYWWLEHHTESTSAFLRILDSLRMILLLSAVLLMLANFLSHLE
jgi:hypothetical protein